MIKIKSIKKEPVGLNINDLVVGNVYRFVYIGDMTILTVLIGHSTKDSGGVKSAYILNISAGRYSNNSDKVGNIFRIRDGLCGKFILFDNEISIKND